jgi:hypothetical protein
MRLRKLIQSLPLPAYLGTRDLRAMQVLFGHAATAITERWWPRGP